MIYLIVSLLKQTEPDRDRVAAMDLSLLCQAADRHMLTGITAFALERAGVCDPAFTEAKGKAIRKIVIMEAEKEALFSRFEEAGIRYLPLKGLLMKDLYPSLGMRQMSDFDILVDPDRRETVFEILTSLGFTRNEAGLVHDVYYKKPVCNFEIHYSLFSPHTYPVLYRYFRDPWPRLIPDGKRPLCFRFTNEDFYLFLTAHEFKHFDTAGTGVRSLVDRYVFLTRYRDSLDTAYLEKETAKLGLTEYESASRELTFSLFEGRALSEPAAAMLDYILLSGTYGTTDQLVKNRLTKDGGGLRSRFRYVLKRLILPMDEIRITYPVFYRVPILLPFLPIYRLFRGMSRNKRNLRTEWKTITGSDCQTEK